MSGSNKLLRELFREELDHLGFGPHGVVDIPNTFYTLPSGERLALRIWAPVGHLDLAEDQIPLIKSSRDVDKSAKLPAVLEYLPYRKADWTAESDHRRHPWLASHGFVVVRADIRGTGDSEGVYHDEYLQQEMDDCCHLIDWISQQSWCSGRVGMYGYSWGGSNGLQVAFLQPPALKAVISLNSTGEGSSPDWRLRSVSRQPVRGRHPLEGRLCAGRGNVVLGLLHVLLGRPGPSPPVQQPVEDPLEGEAGGGRGVLCQDLAPPQDL